MPALYLTEDEVRRLVDMPAAIAAVRGAFAALAAGTAENVPRRRAAAPGVMLHAMHAAAGYLGVVGAKVYATTKAGAVFHVLLYDAATGGLAAMIEADHLGRLRTGAASGVATDLLARPDAKTVGLFGAGKQARTQLEAVCAVRAIERAVVYARDSARLAAFCKELGESLRIEVAPAAQPEQAIDGMDVLVTATSAKTPLFDGRRIAAGTHLNVIGSNVLAKAEIDVETVRRADRIVCDSVAACRLEAGDLAAAVAAGVTSWESITDLSSIVAGHALGRSAPADVTLFKSVGLAVEDVSLGFEALQRAEAAGVGREFP